MSRGLVALGSNQGHDGRTALDQVAGAIRSMAGAGVSVRAVSRFFATPAFPPGSGPEFVNAAVAVDWQGAASELLARLHGIEAAMGRVRDIRWAPRTLDLDLVALGAQILPDAREQDRWRALPLEEQTQVAPDQLILPHPRLQDRGFVLVPLADVAADWTHPRTGRSIAQMVADLPAEARAELRPI